ncbi:DsbC family protein [Congregibacter variabilis]|uniref:Thiol:disulfide interchange protein n=1 Tax=Congregibacter variabilis TaxID=3081200 RepID=A0ABZ0I4M3_9GAMM|nr:DsbC family protein [Congregibacter sp. IMCC43200]
MYSSRTFISRSGLRLLAFWGVSLLFFAQASYAKESVDPKIEKQLRLRLGAPQIGLEVQSVELSQLPGLYRVNIVQGPTIYSTADGDYFIVGDLYNVGVTGLVNLGEQQRSNDRKEAIAAVPEANTIVFPAEGATQSHITVFTDVSCFYCQKLHKEVPELNRRGIEVRYLAYPRQGIGSPGFRQLASAWCSDDRQATLTAFKNREELEENVCPGNPIAEQFALGQQLGVRGTPAIVTPDGEMIPGYRSADDIAALLGLQ